MIQIDPKESALLLIDVINEFDFLGSEDLLRHAVPAAKCLAGLIERLRERQVPVIYVNDNFGRWNSNFPEQVKHCIMPDCEGREVTTMLLPDENDYFVLKPKHSGFYSTPLDVLLGYLGVRTLVLAGFAGDICVLYTANDAYMRDYELVIAEDCIASETGEGNAHALRHMRERLKARGGSADEIRCGSDGKDQSDL